MTLRDVFLSGRMCTNDYKKYNYCAGCEAKTAKIKYCPNCGVAVRWNARFRMQTQRRLKQ